MNESTVFIQLKKQTFFGMCAIIMTAAMIFSGCPMDSDDDGGSYDRDVDIVVVGAGLAGAAAALSTVEAYPNVKVVLIDKDSVVGGSLYRAMGGISGDAYNAKENPAGTITGWKAQSERPGDPVTGYPNYGKVLQIASNTKELLDVAFAKWQIPLTKIEAWGIWGFTNAAGGAISGAAGAQKLHDAVIRNSSYIEFLPETAAKELIVINGVVSGVRAEKKDGASFTIRAKNTILATGGFSQNGELLVNYVDPALVPNIRVMGLYNKSMAAPGAMGDGISMAEKAGAAIYDKAVIHLQGLKYAEELANNVPLAYRLAFSHEAYSIGPQLQFREQIVVNNTGKRFIAESGSIAYGSVGLDGRTLFNDAKPPYYIIFDSNNPNHREEQSGATAAYVDLTAALNAATDLGIGEAYKADTIELLAEAIQVSPVNLASAVSTYNGYVDTGTDADFGKSADLLTKKLEQGPFYAVKLYPESHISMGGVKSDYLGRVLDTNDLIIPHLYAVGELANREFYNVNYVGAASLALYPTWGRMAGLDAAKDAAKNK